jgi:DNA-binding MarR family transcriptional regulator
MAVNLSRPAPEPIGPETRLYLKEEELDRAVELVFVATRRFWRFAEGPLESRGLGPAHYRALAAIRRSEGLPVSALRETLDVTKQSLARVLAELETAGLIDRLPGRTDKRQRLLALTKEGRDAERDATAALRDRLAHIFRSAGAEAVAGARTVLLAMASVEDGK